MAGTHIKASLLVAGIIACLLAGGSAGSAQEQDSGTFLDDDGSVHESDIEALAGLRITRGCNPPSNDRFCPERSVTRAEMAAFLRRATGLPPGNTGRFVDVDHSSVFVEDIGALAEAGITRGCNPPTNDRFCPNRPVTREEMATFLVRAFGLPPAATDTFVDDDDSIHEPAIDRLAAADVTRGCDPPENERFCPREPVTRAQMASFLMRAVRVSDAQAQPDPPIRAAFFYPWFPEAWEQQGIFPYTNYSPSLGFYSSRDRTTITAQLRIARRAGLDAFIASWWGRGHHTDDALPLLLDATTDPSSPHPDLRWSIYYEREGQSDPSVESIVSDLEYLQDRAFRHPAYLRVEGKPVIFVWADGDDGPDMARRWEEAAQRFGDLHVVLKVFSGFRDVVDQPDSWHQYGPAQAYSEHLPWSATVSPGFWKVGEEARLLRDIDRFGTDVERMGSSGAFWHLVTTWNEWGEGTSVEPADEFGTAYVDELGRQASGESFTFTAGGDIGATSATNRILEAMAREDASMFLALGDLSYSDLTPESAWCDYVRNRLGSSFPVEVLVGNHEDDDRVDGHIGAFAACLPDRMGSVGKYGAEYYFDVGDLVRVIMLGSGNDVDGVAYDYEEGTARMAWLDSAIAGARSAGTEWLVVAMHKVCISAGDKPCEIGADLLDRLIDAGVDLVLMAHDHNYQRSKQLQCASVGVFRADCVVDSGSDSVYTKGAGTVLVISGLTGGGGMTEIDVDDAEFPYFAATFGADDPQAGRGYLTISVDRESLTARFSGPETDYRDEFSIHE